MYFKCTKQCVKSRLSSSSYEMGLQINSIAFNESALKSFIPLWGYGRGSEGGAGCCHGVVTGFDTASELPKGYRWVGRFDRLSRRACKRGVCVTAVCSTQINPALRSCSRYLEWGQRTHAGAVYGQGIKGLAGAGMEGALKVFKWKRSHEYQASEHHLLMIWSEIWKRLIAGSWVKSGISK